MELTEKVSKNNYICFLWHATLLALTQNFMDVDTVVPAMMIDAGGTSVHIGISIHTGEVVVGNIGFDMKMDYTVIGDPVNTVFRLQDMAKPYIDGILLSENTRKASRSALEVREIDKIVICEIDR